MWTSLLGTWLPTLREGCYLHPRISVHWATEFSQAGNTTVLFLWWAFQPQAMATTGCDPALREDGPDLESKENVQPSFSFCSSRRHWRTWFPGLSIWFTDCAWCTGWFPAQVRMWGPLQGQYRFCSLPHICQKWTFWHLTCFCLLHSVCVILTHLALGPFTWQFHFKETHKAGAFKFLLQFCVYNLVFSPALKRCVKCFDRMW